MKITTLKFFGTGNHIRYGAGTHGNLMKTKFHRNKRKSKPRGVLERQRSIEDIEEFGFCEGFKDRVLNGLEIKDSVIAEYESALFEMYRNAAGARGEFINGVNLVAVLKYLEGTEDVKFYRKMISSKR